MLMLRFAGLLVGLLFGCANLGLMTKPKELIPAANAIWFAFGWAVFIASYWNW